MNEIQATTPINPEQLAYELGTGLRVVGPEPDGTYTVKVDSKDATKARLEEAVNAHQADPKWKHPNPPPAPPEPEPPLTEAELKALRGLLRKP